MDINVEKSNDVAIVAIPFAELDAANSVEFKRDAMPVLEAHAKVLFDLTNLRFIDSSGLGAFNSCSRFMNAKHGQMKLCGLSKRVRSAFELLRMHRLLDIRDTREDAVRAFQA
jgi:anti-sigma B factor antagonist